MFARGAAGEGGRPTLWKLRLGIVGFSGLLVVALVGFAGFDIWRDYRDAIGSASRSTENLARMLEEHAAGIFRRADLMLSTVVEAALRAPEGPDDESVEWLLRTYAAFLHAHESIVLVDAAGNVRFDPLDPNPELNLADRDYFTAHRDQPDRDLYVSSSLVSLAGPGRFVGLSRRLSRADGSFAGIVLFAVGATNFRELYSTIDIGPAGNVTLWDGTASRVLARFPADEHAMGRSFELGPLFEKVGGGQRVGTFEALSPLDGVMRTVSYRKLVNAPFVVSVGLAREDYLRRWHDALPSDLGVVAAVTIAILGLSALLLYQLERWSASESRLAAVVANVPGAIYQRRLEPDGRLSYPWISAGIFDLHGFTAADAMRDSAVMFDSIHEDDRRSYQGLLAASADDATPLTWEGRITHRDGRVKWIQVMSRPRRVAGGAVEWNGVIFDITERKRMEAALHAAREAADAASRSKSQFLANMSHELRTPLNAILGFSEILQAEFFGALNPKQREYVGDIHRSGDHLLQVISNILDISKIEAGRDELFEEVLQLLPLVQTQLPLVSPQAQSGGVTLAVAIPETLPALRADAIKLKQMLLNLMTNAIKFTPIGGMVRLTAWIEPPDGPWAGSLAVAVADTGIGMRPEEIPTALEPFRRLEAGRALRNLGTGLGLPIAKAQIELHGGVLEIDSRPGAGTRVTLRFPANRVVRTETPAALGAEPAAAAPNPATGASVA